MKALTEREQLLVALGAAIGSNCVPCVETILPRARAAGIEGWELRLALSSADYVRQKPAARVLLTARAIADGSEGEASCDASCPLDQIEGEPEVQAENKVRNQSGCCG